MPFLLSKAILSSLHSHCQLHCYFSALRYTQISFLNMMPTSCRAHFGNRTIAFCTTAGLWSHAVFVWHSLSLHVTYYISIDSHSPLHSWLSMTNLELVLHFSLTTFTLPSRSYLVVRLSSCLVTGPSVCPASCSLCRLVYGHGFRITTASISDSTLSYIYIPGLGRWGNTTSKESI